MLYDAILVLSFGGPEKRADVIPFLENVLRGRNVPRERMLEVAEHYYRFGGRSPINDQNRRLVADLRRELEQKGPNLPVYWGNRNWHPLLADTLRAMKADGVGRALAFVTSAFSSYSGCRQYLENIVRARAEVGEGAPAIEKLRVFYNHPGFIHASAARVLEALGRIPAGRRNTAHVVYTAHSIPVAMAQNSRYVPQLQESIRLVSESLSRSGDPLVYQSRSGPPAQPWLGPDILEHLRVVAKEDRASDVVVVPIGFISEHMEVLYDLDTQAASVAKALGLNMIRASTVGAHPDFISMIRELILERSENGRERQALGFAGPEPDVCAPDCCAPASRPATASPQPPHVLS
ncbi:MAG TPA: ferrochelatase [Terriglobia bacterium]|nr:ferrochelatase [Terriglobia bacterium]